MMVSRFVIFLVGIIEISSSGSPINENCEGYSTALAYLSKCVMVGYKVDQSDEAILSTIRDHPELSCPCLSTIPHLFPACVENFKLNIECEPYGVQQLVEMTIRDRHDGKGESHDNKEDGNEDKDKEDGHGDKEDGNEDKEDDKDKHDDKDEHGDEEEADGHDDKNKDRNRDNSEGEESDDTSSSLASSEIILVGLGCAILVGIAFVSLMLNRRSIVPPRAKVSVIPMVEPHLTVLSSQDSVGVPSLVIATPLHIEMNLDEENSAY